ncbi:MAG: hypothetical protein R2722_04695 [Tessaracoccus sp.]
MARLNALLAQHNMNIGSQTLSARVDRLRRHGRSPATPTTACCRNWKLDETIRVRVL